MGNNNEEQRINEGSDEEMTIVGFRRSYPKLILTWIGVILSAGFLFIPMSWRKTILMKLTHSQCSVEDAEKVLLEDMYEQQFVETVIRPSDNSLPSKQHTYFHNKKIKYIWDSQHSKFVKVEGLEVRNCANFHSLVDGLNTTEAVFRLQHYGKNSIFIEVQPICRLVLNEIKSPFYIYQMFIVVVWMVQVYYQFALCIVFLSMMSITATVWETRKQSKALRDAVHTEAIVTVLRDGREVQKPSEDLVPGDVILLPQSQFIMVCDAVLLSGNCVVNESMLTGV
ncbi:probable cation-transporting ATPase 13A3 [Nephila pilipes]|uniref:Cation-transporting ATPase n=1 Tax=Nephila pilipes TaxID=299642 RepID=A0A8X6QED2_NEPPI|nr:probable cation-transporting ATPase 13A3 [Nephila pilipes]